MSNENRPIEMTLGGFLRAKRESLKPEDVGLPPRLHKSRVKAQGLRREEVAALASISSTYLMKLEQNAARTHPSQNVLSSLGKALRLADYERRHLFNLARVPLPEAPQAVDQLPVGLQDFLDELISTPAYVLNRYWDTIAWNEAADALLNLTRLTEEALNVPRLLFTIPLSREVIPDWETHAKNVLAQLRVDYGQHIGDPRFAALISDLQRDSEEFKTWWQDVDVRPQNNIVKVIKHPSGLALTVRQISYLVEDAPGLRLITYIPLNELARVNLGTIIGEFRKEIMTVTQ